jgi:hypothetical protein
MNASWKTSTFGAGGLLWLLVDTAKLLTDGDAATNPDWNVVMPALLVAVSALFAKDANVSHAPAPKRKPGKVPPTAFLMLVCACAAGLTGCAGMEVWPIHAKVCKDDVCIGFTIPGQQYGVARDGAKVVTEVQPPTPAQP